MSISEDVAFYDLMESKRKASLTLQNLNNGLPSYWRPMPQVAWYSSDKSCWFVPCGSSYREENIKAWTKLPHPERTEELFDFMDRI
jgi:hypothetical protein